MRPCTNCPALELPAWNADRLSWNIDPDGNADHLKVKVKVYARPLLLLSAILACPGQSSVFRLMPKLAGGYGGGSIKTTLYDPCFRSTTVVQGFPAEYSLKSQHH